MKSSFLDFDTRERRAQRADEQLAFLGVHQCRRALVAYFILASSVDHPRDIQGNVLDRTAWETAATWGTVSNWIARNYQPWKEISEKPPAAGSLSRSLDWWRERGVMLAIPAGRITRKRLYATNLSKWIVQESDRHEMLAEDWRAESNEGANLCAPLRGVARDCASLDRERDSLDFPNEEKTKISLSLSRDQLEELRAQKAFSADTSDRQSYRIVKAWFASHGLPPDCSMIVLGAILAARWRQADHPPNYVATVLKNGVSEKWIKKAEALRKEMQEPSTYTAR